MFSFKKKDKAVKESAMDKVLHDLDITWVSMTIDTEFHSRTKTVLLAPSDELIELLEDNQVNYINYMKFIH